VIVSGAGVHQPIRVNDPSSKSINGKPQHQIKVHTLAGKWHEPHCAFIQIHHFNPKYIWYFGSSFFNEI